MELQMPYIEKRVHELYWQDDINCARTMLTCHDLRPTGFMESDPPHMCEQLTVRGICFAYRYMQEILK
ncbi:MAG: hypothetical protein Q4G60_12585 [bacterium]|nr:hypothetical protein [bacterium]